MVYEIGDLVRVKTQAEVSKFESYSDCGECLYWVGKTSITNTMRKCEGREFRIRKKGYGLYELDTDITYFLFPKEMLQHALDLSNMDLTEEEEQIAQQMYGKLIN